jgi:hypothetical protein
MVRALMDSFYLIFYFCLSIVNVSAGIRNVSIWEEKKGTLARPKCKLIKLSVTVPKNSDKVGQIMVIRKLKIISNYSNLIYWRNCPRKSYFVGHFLRTVN